MLDLFVSIVNRLLSQKGEPRQENRTIKTEEKCPCGKGTVTVEMIYSKDGEITDCLAWIECEECQEHYYIVHGNSPSDIRLKKIGHIRSKEEPDKKENDMVTLNPNITIIDGKLKKHTKASETYIAVSFFYPPETTWEGWVPIEYRRTGINIQSEEELYQHLNTVYDQMKPENLSRWRADQRAFWKEKRNAGVTKSFFTSLARGGWQCVECTLPKNPNWARRIQDLKEFGYTLATDTKRYCPNCHANKTHLLLLPIPRVENAGNGYETWSPALRKRIIKVLGSVDVYENVVSSHCLPDHKFSEIRWDENTKSKNPDDMTDEEIRQKFQLLTNQRNQQKREVCRTCFQTGKRGIIFGIPFFYEGNEKWDPAIPQKGKDAECGCIGCPWYDIERWRNELLHCIYDDEKE